MKATSTNTSNTMRVALYGGSFDPIHRAHVEVANFAHDQGRLDRVVFIPAARSPLKAHGAIASDAERMTMLDLAVGRDPRFEIDPRELNRGATSFTVDTVAEIKQDHPSWELFWILGADQVELLPDWRQIGDLADMVTFLILSRPGYSCVPPSICGFRYQEIEAPLMEHSSSAIREHLVQRRDLGDWLDPAVEAFISSKRLYTR